VLRDTDSHTAAIGFKEYEAAAQALNLRLLSFDVQGPSPEIERTFHTAAAKDADALVTITSTLLFQRRNKIAGLARKYRLPSMFEGSSWVEGGGLISYSSKDTETFRRAAYYVDRILKGAKPTDLPVEQPTKFELVINLQTAKQIGLTIPPNVLARADRVIK
jgi:putative ABC transport system substrate-binding protein